MTIFRLAGREFDPLEAFELLHRPRHARHLVTDVELHDFGPGAVARVRHVDGDGEACRPFRSDRR